MGEMKVLRWGAGHVAYLDPMTGQGVLVLPDPRGDIWLPIDGDAPVAADAVSVHAAELRAVVDALALRGWTFSESDSELDAFLEVGTTTAGEVAVGLLGLDPIISQPTLEEMAEADRELAILAGLAR